MLKRIIISLMLAIMTLIVTAGTARAVALADEVIRQKIDDGTFDAYVEKLRDLRAQGMDQPLPKSASSLALGTDDVITVKVLVLLVDFNDKPYTSGYAAATANDFDSMLFSDNLNPTGSMKNFYYENSYGQYIIEGSVYGWYRAPLGYAEYNYVTSTPAQLAQWTVMAADDDVDYTQFDNDNDGYVDAVIVVHAGTGHEESGSSTEIHSHMSYFGLTPVDGIYANAYTIQPEESYTSQSMSAIGVFCHEWGHILGMPDLYDYDYSSQGVGRWSLMASGNYNNNSKTPAHFDGWCKYQLGWLTPVRVEETMIGAEVPAVEYNPVAYRLNKNGIWTSEYWIIENRVRTGFDAYLPSEGLMIYHIDESAPNNDDEWRPIVFIEPADGKFDLQYARNSGDAGDPWPDGDKYDFHDKTVPDSKYYATISSQVGVWNVSARDSLMTADLEVYFTRPWVELKTIILNDTYGDLDGVPEAGEKIQLTLSLINDWAEASDISVTMGTDDPALDIVIGTSDFPPIAMGGTGSNHTSPFEFQIPEVFQSRVDSFFFDLTANGDTYHIQLGAEANVGRPQLLIVDDDNGDPAMLEQYLAWPLYAERTPSDIWHVNLVGSPTAFDLNNYHIVMWLTGNVRDFILNTDDIEAMTGYLNAGGNLFLTGQGLADQMAVQHSDFLNNYLKTSFISDTIIPAMILEKGDGPVSAGSKFVVLNGGGSAGNQTITNYIAPAGDGMGEWKYVGTDKYGAVSYSGAYKSVFFSFGYEGIRSSDTRFETQATVMARILDFFGDLPTDVADPSSAAANLPTRFMLGQNFPNPFNPITTISYVITGSGPRIDRTRLDIFNILGQHVRTLVDRDEVPGPYSVLWDGRDQSGQDAASGLYFYRLTRGDQEETRKMILLK